MGILITVAAVAIGWLVYQELTDLYARQRWREAHRDRLRMQRERLK